jgi:acetyl esterase
MPVHPLVAARFPLLDGIPVPLIDGIPDFHESLNNPEFIEQFLAYAAPYSAYSMPNVHIEDLTIDGPLRPIPIRLYRPRSGGTDRPGLLWVHGGAFVTGQLDMTEAHVVSAELAARGAVAASVDYRLATRTLRYPAPLDDVDAAWRWFSKRRGVPTDRCQPAGDRWCKCGRQSRRRCNSASA